MTFAFDSLDAFFAMGKHGFYVWLSYGTGFVVILINILLANRQRTQAFEQVRRLQRLDAASAQHLERSGSVAESNPAVMDVGKR